MVLGAAACGTSSSDDDSAGSKKLETLNVAYTTGGSAIKWFVGQEKGFFKKRGLNVKPVAFEGGFQAAAALKQGSVDINLTGATGVATALAAGVDVKGFYADYDEARGDWLVASTNKKVKTVKDLPGKTVSTLKGLLPWYCLQALLEQEDMVDKVTYKDLKVATWAPAIQNGDVDVVQAFPPQAQRLVAAGGTMVAQCSDYLKETIVWIGADDVLKKKKESVMAWIGGMDDAGKWIETHKEETIDIWAKYAGVSPEDAKAAIEYIDFLSVDNLLDPSYEFNMVNDTGLAKEFDEYQRILETYKMLPEKLSDDLANRIDATYVKAFAESK